MVQDGRQKHAKMIFSLPDTINYKKKTCWQELRKKSHELHKGVYRQTDWYFIDR